jgi:hypothetical protein
VLGSGLVSVVRRSLTAKSPHATVHAQRTLVHQHRRQGLANLLASDASSFMTGAVIALDGGGTSGYFATLPRAAG